MNQSEKQNVSKVAKNSLISGFGSIISLVMLPITGVITTRVLGAELYGIYSLVQSWSSILANISSLGLNGTNLRFVPVYKALNEKAKIKGSIYWTLQVTAIVGLSLTIFIILFPSQFCSAVVYRMSSASSEIYETTVNEAFRFYAVSIFMTSIYLVFVASLNGMQEIKYKILSNEIIGSVAKISSLLLFIFMGWDLYAAFSSNLVQDVVILCFSLYFLLKVFPEIKNPAVKPVFEKKKMNKFAVALFSKSMLNNYTFQLDILFLGFFSAARDVGIYTVALRLQPLIYLPYYTIKLIFDPLVAELYTTDKITELGKLYKTVTQWAFTLSLPLFGTIVLYSNEILNIFGRDFTDGMLLLLILSVGNLINNLLGLSGNMIMMIGRINVNLLNSVVMAVVNSSLYFFLIKFYGIIGAAIGNCLSLIILNTLTMFQVGHFLGIYPFKKSLLKPIISLAGSILFVEGVRIIYELPYYKFTFIVYVFLLWTLYVIGLFALKLDDQDTYVLRKIAAKFPLFAKILPKSYRPEGF